MISTIYCATCVQVTARIPPSMEQTRIPAKPTKEVVFYGASLIVSTATLLLSAVPAAISERLGLSLERAMMVWFGTSLLLVLMGLG